MNTLLMGFSAYFTNPGLVLYIALFVFLGIYIGAIPGLSVTMAVSILISFTFSWNTLTAIAAMIGVQVGGVYGGSRSAILLNIPGAPAALATAFDGYPLAQKGLAAEAISITVIQSVIGGLIGVLILSFGAPLLSGLALKFAPRDYFLLGIMGLLLIGSLASQSLIKGIFSALLGLFFGLVGLDSVTGQAKFTFSTTYLMGGLHYIIIMLGVFGVSEALFQLRDLNIHPVKQKIDRLRPNLKNTLSYLPLTIKSSLIGCLIGALPGTGGDIAALLAYDHAKRTTRNPKPPFGQGAIEGIVAPEAANNAAIGGAYIPMLTLGIPGDAVTAIILGSMMIHGLRPGPMFMAKSPDIFGFIVVSNIMANFFLLVFGFLGIRIFAKIVEIPKFILMPIIMVLSIVGAYSINNNIVDVYWMLGFGLFGYLLKLYDFPLAPMVLGAILSSLVELNFRRGLAMAGDSLLYFILDIVTNPISLVLSLAIILMLLRQANLLKGKN